MPLICPTRQVALANAGSGPLLCMGLFSIFWENVLSRLSTAAMVPARVVDSLASALRGRRSTLSYVGMIGAGGEDRTPDLGFTKTLHFRCATPA